jgi:hypothetical protein
MEIVMMRGATISDSGPIPSLNEYLDIHEQGMKAVVAQFKKPEDDIAPIFYFIDAKGGEHCVFPDYRDKNRDVAAFRAIMEDKGAVMYCLVTSAWMVKFPTTDQAKAKEQMATFEREGSGGSLKHLRVEIAQVSAGDRNGTVTRMWQMHRNPHTGRVTLTNEGDQSLAMTGRMVDLLAEPRH